MLKRKYAIMLYNAMQIKMKNARNARNASGE